MRAPSTKPSTKSRASTKATVDTPPSPIDASRTRAKALPRKPSTASTTSTRAAKPSTPAPVDVARPLDPATHERLLLPEDRGNQAPRRRVVGYIRVSTEEQALHGASLGAQEAKLRAYALAMDLELVAVESDAGVSAKTLERPALKRALARLEAGEATGLLIAKLDRLTRSVRDLGDLLDGYFVERFTLLSMADSIDTQTASGRLVLYILGVIAQWERETIAERTRDALAHRRATGGGTPRLEGPALERIVELADEGLSFGAIAARLTKEGVPTLKGGRWARETVRKVLARCAA